VRPSSLAKQQQKGTPGTHETQKKFLHASLRNDWFFKDFFFIVFSIVRAFKIIMDNRPPSPQFDMRAHICVALTKIISMIVHVGVYTLCPEKKTKMFAVISSV